MLVTPYDDERLFVTMQTDHSRVAGFLAAQWGNSKFAKPEPWNSVVLAAQEHDRGWWQWECRPTLSDAGGPLDYQNDTLHHLGELRTRIYRSSVEELAPIDPYAAVLVLDHLTGLLTAGNGAFSFRKDVSDHPVARPFLAQQGRLREQLIAQLRASPETGDHADDARLIANGQVVEVCDALAQFLCNRFPLDSGNRGKDPNRVFSEITVPTRPGEPDVFLALTVLDERRLAIDPFPFDAPLQVNYVARWMPSQPFDSQQAFLERFYRAETQPVSYELVAA